MPATNRSLFYNSENGDRVYDADSFEHLLKKFFTSGVFTGNCQVSATTGMGVSVSAGYANTDGKIRFFDETTALTLDNAHGTYNRIDTIVVERNDTNREITLKVVKGTNAADPTPTEPVRTGGIYQLVLAEVYVHAGATSITDAVITDKRPDTDVCGYVICAVDTPDFSELFAQFQAQASEFIDTQTTEFMDWFDAMKDQLSEDAAGHLQLEIGTLSSLETKDKTDLVSAINENAVGIDQLFLGILRPVERWLRFNPENKKGLIIKAGTHIRKANGAIKSYLVDTAIDLSEDIDTSGADYAVYLLNDDTITAALISATAPENSRKIGRFHTLCVNVGDNVSMVAPASPSSGMEVGVSTYLIKPYRQEKDPDFYAFYLKTISAKTVQSAYDLVTMPHPLSGFEAGTSCRKAFSASGSSRTRCSRTGWCTIKPSTG